MPKTTFLDFEEDLKKIQFEIDTLEEGDAPLATEKRAKLATLEKRYAKRMSEIYADLTDWQIVQVARHPSRPYALDYIERIFEDFIELHGDRQTSDDASIVAGLAHLGTHRVAVIGQQKGRDIRERTRRNFGMTRPEGYRKALRMMALAEKFNLPLILFVDTPGAYPGLDAEEHNQAEAIGRAILKLTRLRVPVVSVVIGEGGSGGALALAVADTVMILQYAIYSVISPEGCASILWKDAARASEAAEALSLTAGKLLKLGLIDKVVPEPLGGAHRDPRLMVLTLKKTLIDQLRALLSLSVEDLLDRRERRLLYFGRFGIELAPESAPPRENSRETLEVGEVAHVKKVSDSAQAHSPVDSQARPIASAPSSNPPKARTKKTTKTTSPKKPASKKPAKGKLTRG